MNELNRINEQADSVFSINRLVNMPIRRTIIDQRYPLILLLIPSTLKSLKRNSDRASSGIRTKYILTPGMSPELSISTVTIRINENR
jgi:hypothetical protein